MQDLLTRDTVTAKSAKETVKTLQATFEKNKSELLKEHIRRLSEAWNLNVQTAA